MGQTWSSKFGQPGGGVVPLTGYYLITGGGLLPVGSQTHAVRVGDLGWLPWGGHLKSPFYGGFTRGNFVPPTPGITTGINYVRRDSRSPPIPTGNPKPFADSARPLCLQGSPLEFTPHGISSISGFAIWIISSISGFAIAACQKSEIQFRYAFRFACTRRHRGS